MGRKKIKPGYEVVDNRPPPLKFPIHENEAGMESSIGPDGSIVYEPSDPFCSIRVKEFVSTDRIYAWVIEGRRYIKDVNNQWTRGKKWEVVGYISPYTYQMQFLARSNFINENIGPLVRDIQEHERIMKERIKRGDYLK